jgi:hypothetical protein
LEACCWSGPRQGIETSIPAFMLSAPGRERLAQE